MTGRCVSRSFFTLIRLCLRTGCRLPSPSRICSELQGTPACVMTGGLSKGGMFKIFLSKGYFKRRPVDQWSWTSGLRQAHKFTCPVRRALKGFFETFFMPIKDKNLHQTCKFKLLGLSKRTTCTLFQPTCAPRHLRRPQMEWDTTMLTCQHRMRKRLAAGAVTWNLTCKPRSASLGDRRCRQSIFTSQLPA